MFDTKKRMEELAISFDYYVNNYSQYKQQYSTLQEQNKEETKEAIELAEKAQISLNIINSIQMQIKELSQRIRDMELENGLEPTISALDEPTEDPKPGR